MSRKKTKRPAKVLDFAALDLSELRRRFPWPEGFQLKHGKFGRRSQKHWQEQARRLFAECLLRASMVDTQSPVGAMVEQAILNYLKKEDPDMLVEMIDERARCQQNLALFVAGISSRKDPISKKIQEAGLLPRIRRAG